MPVRHFAKPKNPDFEKNSDPAAEAATPPAEHQGPETAAAEAAVTAGEEEEAAQGAPEHAAGAAEGPAGGVGAGEEAGEAAEGPVEEVESWVRRPVKRKRMQVATKKRADLGK